MLDLILAGGWVMWPIVFASMVATSIIFERSWVLRASVVSPVGLFNQIRNMHSTERLTEEQMERIREASLLGKVLASMYQTRRQGVKAVVESAEMAGRTCVHQMERNLVLLGSIASVCPLLGILGTVVGMIKVFGAVTAGGLGNADALAGGIGEALLTTAVGISVAVPTLLFHTYFMRRVDTLVLELENVASSFQNWMLQEGLLSSSDNSDK